MEPSLLLKCQLPSRHLQKRKSRVVDDIKPTPTRDIIVRFLRRQMPAYVDTGLNIYRCSRFGMVAFAIPF